MDPEQAGGLGLLTLRPLEHPQDVAALHLDEREVWGVDLCQGLVRRRGEVVAADDRPWGEDHETLDGVGELSDVPRPRVVDEKGASLFGDRLRLLARKTELVQEMIDQGRLIVSSRARIAGLRPRMSGGASFWATIRFSARFSLWSCFFSAARLRCCAT